MQQNPTDVVKSTTVHRLPLTDQSRVVNRLSVELCDFKKNESSQPGEKRKRRAFATPPPRGTIAVEGRGGGLTLSSRLLP